MLELLGLPPQAATHAAEIDQMTAVVHWLMLVLFVGWGAFFVFVLFRFRKSANPKASYTGAKGKFAKSTEVAVAIFEAILQRDYPLVQACILFIAVTYVAMNLLVDLAYGWLDPRIRVK